MLTRTSPSFRLLSYVRSVLLGFEPISQSTWESGTLRYSSPRSDKPYRDNRRKCYSIISRPSPPSKSSLLSLHKTEPIPKHFVFRSTSTDPYLNLAIEHHILTQSHPESTILFLYINRPCVVIGRNQNPWLECNLKSLNSGIEMQDKHGHSRRERILLVRRRSGGGTVFHDEGNLNYSVIAPHDKDWNRNKHAQMVANAIKHTKLLGNSHDREVRVNERHDIVMKRGPWTNPETKDDELKISGSAFKLTRGRALHHGTLLFSSPNLNKISPLLRSPARGFISAKGVESVRSPVGNLCHTNDPSTRKHQGEELSRMIHFAFCRIYNLTGGALETGGEAELENDEIRRGADELMSEPWRWEQTPSFVFSTHPIPGQGTFTPQWKPTDVGLPPEAKVVLKVKNSVIQEVEICLSSDPETASHEQDKVRAMLSGKKLHEISSDWKSPISRSISHPSTGSLISWLQMMLPPFKTIAGKSSSQMSLQSVRE